MAAFNAKTNVGWSHREGLFNTCLGFSGQSQKHGGQTKQVESLRKIEGSRTEPAQSHHLVRGGLRPCHTTFRTILQTKERTQTPTTITNGPTLTIVFHHFPPPQVFSKKYNLYHIFLLKVSLSSVNRNIYTTRVSLSSLECSLCF